MQKNTNNITQLVAYSLLITCMISLLGVSIYKARMAAYTYDESLTYNWYVQGPLLNVILFTDRTSANNHILNTLLTQITNLFFGSSELSLRLPNIISHIIFMIFVILIIKLIKIPHILYFPFFIIIVLNPYLLDFFSLGRGYGLSVMFVTGSLFFFIKHLEDMNVKDYSMSLLFAALGTYSNFTTLYFFIAIATIYNINHLIIWFFNNEKITLKLFFFYNKHSIIYSTILSMLIGYPVYRLFIAGELYFGIDDGFWKGTLRSLFERMIYDNSSYLEHVVFISIMITLVLMLFGTLLLLFSLFRKDIKAYTEWQAFILLSLLLTIITISVYLQHYILGSKYIYGRTALFLWPVISILLCLFLAHTYRNQLLRTHVVVLCLLLSIAIVSHTIKAYNLNSYYDWRYGVDTKEMLETLQGELTKEDHHPNSVNLGINWVFDSAINYYRISHKMDWLKEVDRSPLNSSQDFYYVLEDDIEREKLNNYTVIKRFNRSKTYLLKNNKL
jgi:hypothetical protein